MKRVAAFTVTLAAVVAALAVGVSASGSDGPTAVASKTKTIRLLAITTSQNFVDNPPQQTSETQPPSPGDIDIFTDNLFSRGKRVGRDQAFFTTVTRTSAEGTATLFLGKGHIVVTDGFSFAKRSQRLAISGGTGAYRNARGDVQVTTISDTRTRLVVRLIY